MTAIYPLRVSTCDEFCNQLRHSHTCHQRWYAALRAWL